MHRPFYSLNEYYRELFGIKTYKISLNAGMTCPNRDGTLGTRGCIFCSAGGSGDFATDCHISITDQINDAINKVAGKYSGKSYIAYFQAFTNTYANTEELERIFTEAINNPLIVGLSIGTRPDCLEPDKIALLQKLNKIKPVFIELGLQTIKEQTAKYIRRGYPLSVFEDTLKRLNYAGISVVVHVILGLPGETHDDYMKCAKYLAHKNIQGIKIQLLHVLKNCDLVTHYLNNEFRCMTEEEYITSVIDFIELLPPDIVIHRITGDGPKKLLIAPLWSSNKKHVLNAINNEFRIRNTYQGKEFR